MAKRIGEYLQERKLLTPEQVEQVLQHSHRTRLRFGDAALDLGLVRAEDLSRVMGPRYAEGDFFHLDAAHFPKVTQAVFSIEQILKWGVLPLGIKTEGGLFRSHKALNVGFLDPRSAALREEVKAHVIRTMGKQGVSRMKPYLVAPDQFLSVLQVVYEETPETLRRRKIVEIEATLRSYLGAR